MRGMRCRHCLSYDVPPDAPSPVCGRCVQLMTELADEQPQPKPRRVHNGRWLVWACNRRGRLRDAQRIGRAHGFPRRLDLWSLHQVEVCVHELQRTSGSKP